VRSVSLIVAALVAAFAVRAETNGLEVARGGTNELAVARQALRDGLWSLARTHAAKVVGDEARLVTLESYARENRWEDIRKTLSGWKDADGDGFDYYRSVLAGDFRKAAGLLRKSGCALAEAEAKMLEADLLAKGGDGKGAAKLWREVGSMTNASERARVSAALNLGEADTLRAALEKTTTRALRQQLGLRLGAELVRTDTTFSEGEKLIRAIVKDFPDAAGAKEAFVALASAEASGGRSKDAAKTYSDAVEIWPEAAKLFAVQEGRGEVFLKLGRREEALNAFERAEACAQDDADRALAVLKRGDALIELGRGTEAMAQYRRVLEKYPDTPTATALKRMVALRELETKGREAFKDYRFEEARKAFAQVGEEDPSRRARMSYFDVLCRYGLGQDDAAKAGARKLAESCDDPAIRAEATLWLAKFTFNRGEWKESCMLFGAFAALMPDHAYAPQALAWATRAAYADGDFAQAIQTATRLVERYPTSPACFAALLVQGEALIEQARFGEAVLVLERVAIAEGAGAAERMRARLLKADALFAMGADNPARYTAALEAYRAIRFGGTLEPSLRLAVSFKIARTLEKLRRFDESADEYYSQVILAYRDGRLNGERYDDDARAAFSRAAFRLADEFESRGKEAQAESVLRLVAESDVPAAEEAQKRLERISTKGRFL